MTEESKRGMMIVFYNEAQAPYQVFIYPDNVDQVCRIMRHCVDLFGYLEKFTFTRYDYRFELLLGAEYARQPSVFVHRHLEEPMKEIGYQTAIITGFHELEPALKARNA